jgi:hypothetical protein
LTEPSFRARELEVEIVVRMPGQRNLKLACLCTAFPSNVASDIALRLGAWLGRGRTVFFALGDLRRHNQLLLPDRRLQRFCPIVDRLQVWNGYRAPVWYETAHGGRPIHEAERAGIKQADSDPA